MAKQTVPDIVQEIIKEAIAAKPTRIERKLTYGKIKFRFSAKVVNDPANRQTGKAKQVLPYLSTTLKSGIATGARLFLINDLQVRILINLDSAYVARRDKA